MRIALLNAQVPFVRGGAELLAEGLQRQLRQEGHEAEIVSVPINWHPSSKLLDSLLAGSLIDLDELGGLRIDLAIGLKFPAYLAKHARKRFWIIHQHRQAYDHWESGSSNLLHEGDGALVKAAIETADRQAFEGRPVFTISRNVSDRLQHFLNVPSTPIYHPPPLAPHLGEDGGKEGDYLLVPSRIGPAKRQDLIIEALAECREKVKLVVVGNPDDPAYLRQLRRRVTRLDLDDRVTWLSGVPVDELATLYAEARAVVFAPVDEDYGYVTLEAMLSRRPVLTTTDAGGPLEFIRNGKEGLIVAPGAKALAEAMDRLWSDRDQRRAFGEAGRIRYDEMEIGWPQVLDHLLDREPQAGGAICTIPPPPATATENPIATAAPASPPRPPADELAERLSVDRAGIVKALPAEARSLDAVLDSFDLGRHASREVRNYLEGHWLRYLETVSLVPDGRGLRILDLGGGKPHAFLGLVHLARENASFAAIVEAQHEADGREVYPSNSGRAPLAVETRAANLETARLPFDDGSFDVVLAMEVLEHLALNPAHMFAEAARVLRPGGTLIVTTPNIVSYRAVSLAKAGNAPYSFGVFVPYHGVYGRHNREYTPHEVELLGRMTGFATSALNTRDVYRGEVDAFTAILPSLRQSEFPIELRGQNIFYKGVKTGAPEPTDGGSLYLDDPFAYRGTVRAEHRDDLVRLHLHNQGSANWTGDTIAMRISTVEPDRSTRAHDVALPLAVPAGTERVLDLPIGPISGQATSVMTVAFEQSGRGWLNFIGLANIRFAARAGAVEIVEREYGKAPNEG